MKNCVIIFANCLLLMSCLTTLPRVPEQFSSENCLNEHFDMRFRVKDEQDEYHTAQIIINTIGLILARYVTGGILVSLIGAPIAWLTYDQEVEREIREWQYSDCNEK